MDRRTFVHASALSLLGVPLCAAAQRAGTMPRIGLLTPGPNPRESAFLQGMRDLGYVDGKNIVDRSPLRGGRFRATAGPCGGARQESAGRHRRDRLGGRARRKAGHRDDTDRDGRRLRSGRVRPGRQSRASRRQRHRDGQPIVRRGRQGIRAYPPVAARRRRVAALWNPANANFQQLMLSEALAAAARLHMLLRLIEVRTREELDRTFAALGSRAAGCGGGHAGPFFRGQRGTRFRTGAGAAPAGV